MHPDGGQEQKNAAEQERHDVSEAKVPDADPEPPPAVLEGMGREFRRVQGQRFLPGSERIKLLGQATEKYGSFTFGNLLHESIAEARRAPNFQRVHDDVCAGNRKCAETCQYYKYCGGAAPSNKYYENGTFDSAETMHCRYMIQMPMNIVMADLDRQMSRAAS